MDMTVCCVRDVKADFLNPFCTNHVGTAIRSFGDEVGKPDSPISAHPADFSLYELGVFHSDNGTFTLHPQPKHLADAASFVKQLELPLSKVKAVK